jgi:dipeptide/tripeptide permease
MLLIAFSLLAAGYFLSGNMSTYGTVFTGLLVMASGAGLFKPIISGTIARTTSEKNSGFGFGIYYWMINLGAFLAPLVVSIVKGLSWSYVFGLSSLYCALMLIPAVFLYRDPPKPENTKTVAEVLRGAALVLGDARFMLMILVYSGFWILYFQNFGSILWFLRDFVDPEPVNRFFTSLGMSIQFDAEHVTVINAGTIILLQVVVSRILKNVAPLQAMVAGMVIGVLGFVCLSFASTPWIFILGIVVFSIGEMTAHPKYYSYIGLVAPADKKAVYMGYAFLYGVIGSLVGSNLGGVLYESMLKPLVGQAEVGDSVQRFWLLFAVLGGLAAGGLILYNRYFAADTPENNTRARQVMTVLYSVFFLVGVYFVYTSVAWREEIAYRSLVQATIMVLLGGSGLAVTFQRRQ